MEGEESAAIPSAPERMGQAGREGQRNAGCGDGRAT